MADIAAILFKGIFDLVAGAVKKRVTYETEGFLTRLKVEQALEKTVRRVVEQLIPFLESERVKESNQELLIGIAMDELYPFAYHRPSLPGRQCVMFRCDVATNHDTPAPRGNHETKARSGTRRRSMANGRDSRPFQLLCRAHQCAANGKFPRQVTYHWYKALRRRSQRTRLNWAQMNDLATRWLPRPRIMHPWPEQRFDARTQGRSRVRYFCMLGSVPGAARSRVLRAVPPAILPL